MGSSSYTVPPLCGRQDLGVWETVNLFDNPMEWLLFPPNFKDENIKVQ